MIDENERRWKELCRQATVELDPEKAESTSKRDYPLAGG